MSSSAEVSISYSHNNERSREQLDAHLSHLRDEGLISDWHDRAIFPTTCCTSWTRCGL